jgi:hypothetical protein
VASLVGRTGAGGGAHGRGSSVGHGSRRGEQGSVRGRLAVARGAREGGFMHIGVAVAV